jgi:hypothetical protein
LKQLLRDILDPHSKTLQATQNSRPRNYDDEIQCYDYEPPQDAPEWAFVIQPNAMYDSNHDSNPDTAGEDNLDESSNKSNPVTDAE